MSVAKSVAKRIKTESDTLNKVAKTDCSALVVDKGNEGVRVFNLIMLWA